MTNHPSNLILRPDLPNQASHAHLERSAFRAIPAQRDRRGDGAAVDQDAVDRGLAIGRKLHDSGRDEVGDVAVIGGRGAGRVGEQAAV